MQLRKPMALKALKSRPLALGKRSASDVVKVIDEVRSERKAKRKKKKAKGKKAEKGWFDYLLSGLSTVGSLAAKFLPLFLAKASKGAKSVTVFNSKRTLRADAGIAVSQPFEIKAEPSPALASNGDVFRVTHSELLDSVTIPAGTKKGEALKVFDLNPYMAPWLRRMANYERYRAVHIGVTLTPMLASTTDGGVLGVFEWDPDDLMGWGNAACVNEAMAHKSASAVDVWTSHSWVWAPESGDWLYVAKAGHEKRLTDAGRFSLVAATDFASEVDLGFLRVTYDVEFRVPELNKSALGTFDASRVADSTVADPKSWTTAEIGVVRDGTNTDYFLRSNYLKITTCTPTAENNFYRMELPRGAWLLRGYFWGAGTLLYTYVTSHNYGGYLPIVDELGGAVSRIAAAGTSAIDFDIAIYSSGYAASTELDPTADIPGVVLTVKADNTNYMYNGFVVAIPLGTELPNLAIAFAPSLLARLAKVEERLKEKEDAEPESVVVTTSRVVLPKGTMR